MNKKLLVSFFLFCLFAFSFFPLVSCHEETIFNTNPNTLDTKLSVLHPSSSADYSAVGIPFDVGAGEDMFFTRFQITLHKVGSPNYNVSMRLYGATGTFPNLSVDTDNLIRQSSTVVNSTVVDVTGNDEWYFSFDGSYQFIVGNWYVAVIYIVAFESGDTSNCLQVYRDVLTGQQFNYANSDWVTDTSNAQVRVWANHTAEPTPTPSPVPAVTQNAVPSDPFVAVPSYYMVLLVLFACVAVLAGLYVTFEREGENKGVALLFVLVGLVLFVILIVGYFVGL